MGRLLLGGLLAGLAVSVFRARKRGWKYAILPAMWVAALVPLLSLIKSGVLQFVGLALMVLGAWFLDALYLVWNGLAPSLGDVSDEPTINGSGRATSRTSQIADQPELGIVELLDDRTLTPEQYQHLKALDKIALERRYPPRRRHGDAAPLLSAACTPTLSRTLQSEVGKVRYASVRLLGYIGGERSVELLAGALASDDEHTVRRAARRLGDIARSDRSDLRQVLPELVQCLDGQSGSVANRDRWLVVRAIAFARAPDTVGLLARCAVEPSGSVRRWAADGLFRLGNQEAREALENAVAQLSLVKGRHARRCLFGLQHDRE